MSEDPTSELADVLSAWIESAPVEIRTTDAALVGRGTLRGLDSLIANRTKQIETIRSTKSQRDLVATITLPGGYTSSHLINPGMATGEIKGILRNSISESLFNMVPRGETRAAFQVRAGEKERGAALKIRSFGGTPLRDGCLYPVVISPLVDTTSSTARVTAGDDGLIVQILRVGETPRNVVLARGATVAIELRVDRATKISISFGHAYADRIANLAV